MNLSKALQEAVARDGETIEAIVVGKHDRAKYREPAKPDENVLLSVADGLQKLDYEYDNGYGGADCHPFLAWTPSKVWFITEYDGATDLAWVPRNPVTIEPEFSGQA